jgi:hypothetical protein
MLDIAGQKLKERMEPVGLRLPHYIREKAKDMAQQQSSSRIKIHESDVYREIILNFFSTDCQSNIDNIGKDGGNAIS